MSGREGSTCDYPLDDGTTCDNPVSRIPERCWLHGSGQERREPRQEIEPATLDDYAGEDPFRAQAASDFDLARLSTVLAEHDTDYVLIGGMASILHGSAHLTADIDICPARTDENLRSLAEALHALDARLVIQTPRRTVIPYDWRNKIDEWSQFDSFRTLTGAGEVDVVFDPDAPGGRAFDFEQLTQGAVVYTLELDGQEFEVPTAALDDIIASKEAAGRDKDRRVLPLLRSLMDRLRRDGES